MFITENICDYIYQKSKLRILLNAIKLKISGGKYGNN